ncbi:zinc finger (CCCH type) protein, putative [Eimeria maxima]|uniref:Zinc finger (CCCH type) protein, putative n=1 Tax=Eimeria maxima TaxID=5804 RepID=U6M4F0_EIMMA|nr:zinc finger (CCCH type) protein, putative [Eimeria maxima]CDJ57958.1 zinc finger (CCCH type) protein, putative [Eimeria maxima]
MATRDGQPSLAYRTVLCRYFQSGYCPAGEKCTFIHSSEDSLTPATQQCKNFLMQQQRAQQQQQQHMQQQHMQQQHLTYGSRPSSATGVNIEYKMGHAVAAAHSPHHRQQQLQQQQLQQQQLQQQQHASYGLVNPYGDIDGINVGKEINVLIYMVVMIPFMLEVQQHGCRQQHLLRWLQHRIKEQQDTITAAH